MPPASQMGIYVDLCESYLFCLEKIDCPDAQKHLHPREKSVSSMCNGMKFMAGPFGKCVESILLLRMLLFQTQSRMTSNPKWIGRFHVKSTNSVFIVPLYITKITLVAVLRTKETIRSNNPSLKKYPCARHLIKKVGRPGNCEMYQKEYECTTILIKDKCGIEAMEEMETHKSYILNQMHCK